MITSFTEMSPHIDVAFDVVPFDEWRNGIAPLWHMQGTSEYILKVLNGHGQMRYVGREVNRRVLLFPLVASVAGARVGWTSVYNISDEAVRIRGIYVHPDYRAFGIGRLMVEQAIALWPAEFNRCFIYARESNVERYSRWGFRTCAGYKFRSFEMKHLVDDKRVLLMTKHRTDAGLTTPTSRAVNTQPAM